MILGLSAQVSANSALGCDGCAGRAAAVPSRGPLCSPGSSRCWLWAGWLLVLSFCEASACLARGGLPSAELLGDNTELELHAEQDGATQPHSCGHCSLEDHQVLSPNSSPGCSMMHGLASRDALEIHIVHLFKSSSPPHPSDCAAPELRMLHVTG